MKKRFFTTIIAAAMSAMIFLPSCNKDDNADPEPNKEEQKKEEPKIEYDSSDIYSLFLVSNYSFFNPDVNNPKDGDTACRCFSTPLTIGTSLQKIYAPIEAKVLDNLTYTYRYEITDCTIADASGENMAIEYTPNEGTNILMIPHKDLTPNTEYTFSTTITLTQLIDGEWHPVIYKDKTFNYTNTLKFTTGKLSDNFIDKEEILYQYPIDRQRYYLPEEYKQGYIMMSYTYSKIFDGVPAENLKVVISSVSDETQPRQTTSFSYKECHDVERQVAEINYSLENITFLPQSIYRFDFLCGKDTVYYMHLATSKHPDFKTKIATYDITGNKINQTASTNDPHDGAVQKELVSVISNDVEYFDEYEINIGEIGLIRMELDLDNCEWYINSYFKLFYDNYTIYHNSPDNNKWKIPPSNAMGISYRYRSGSKLLSENEIKNKTINFIPYDKDGRVWCLVQTVMVKDFDSMWSSFSKYHSELESKFCMIYHENNSVTHLTYTEGEYPFSLSYCLPGKNIVTFTDKYVWNYTGL